MKRFISILMLVCLMASFFTLSAYAEDPIVIENGWYELCTEGTYGSTDYREYITLTLNSSSSAPVAQTTAVIVELWNGGTIISRTEYISSSTIGTELSCRVVLSGKASGSWKTEWFENVSDSNAPNIVKLYIDGKDFYEFPISKLPSQSFSNFPDGNQITANPPQPTEKFHGFYGPNIKIKNNFGDDNYRESIGFGAYLEGSAKTIGAKIYAGGALVAETVGKPDGDLYAGGALDTISPGEKTYNVVLFGDPSGSWDTKLYDVTPGVYPDKIVFTVDGKDDLVVTFVLNDEAKELYDNFDGAIEASKPAPAPVAAAKPAASSVPATADNSNMPLWTVLLLGFAAIAIATKRKKA